VCRMLLTSLGVDIGSHVVALGGIVAKVPDPLPARLNRAADYSPVRCLDPEASQRMVAAIDAAKDAGDTLGGIGEIVARGLVAGLGSHVSWDRKLDGRLAQALMSIPAVKGVGIGLGFNAGDMPGSQSHDEILREVNDVNEVNDTRLTSTSSHSPHLPHSPGNLRGGFYRPTNRAGGLEGGITNGEDLVLRFAKKPISTLMQPLRSVNLDSGEEAKAQSERSDVTAVPAAAVIAEAMTALVLADAYAEKFGGDSLREMRRNFDAFVARLGERAERWER
jgi:chorismate synthase